MTVWRAIATREMHKVNIFSIYTLRAIPPYPTGRARFKELLYITNSG